MVLLFWCRLTPIVLEKRPINGYVEGYCHQRVSVKQAVTLAPGVW